MKDTIWLFPLLFIFHDLEEIIGFMPWIERNEKLLAKKAAFILNTHKGLSTEGFALAVALLFFTTPAYFISSGWKDLWLLLFIWWLISCKLSGLGAISQLLRPLSCAYQFVVSSFGKQAFYFISTQLNCSFSVSLAFSSSSVISFLHSG